MGFLDLLRGSPRLRFDGTSGVPTSSNAASSFHLRWEVPAGTWVAAEAVLEVVVPPSVPALHFWALQVSFAGGWQGGGGAHLGLQRYERHPGSTAVNWGGYAAGGGELAGSASELPSATDNPNTRDLAWVAGRPYRLRVEPVGAGPDGTTAWRGSVTDLVAGERTVVRDLWAPGDRLDGLMVWSEVFARCDDPSSEVRWSDLAVIDATGHRAEVRSVGVNYQTVAAGGCTTTTSEVAGDGQGWTQRTGTTRTTPQGAHLSLPA